MDMREFVRKPFYSPRELAALIDVDPTTVMDHIHAGKIHAVQISERIYRIPLATVVSTLYPEEVGEPVFRRSRDPAARSRADRTRARAEETAARALQEA